jgi:hypothetical protein
MKKIITNTLLVSALLASNVNAAELQHSFSSPSFSGVGYSSHVLTIQQLESQQKDKNKAAADALAAKAISDAANTPQAQFAANLQSRIYSQLAKQITDSLFSTTSGAPGCSGARVTLSGGGTVCGLVEVAGNNVTWDVVGTNIVIKIQNVLDPRQVLNMTVPAGSFGF